MKAPQTLYNRIAGGSPERLAALSDGVFAIAMTLIVIDIKVPAVHSIHSDRDLLDAFCNLSPRLLMYFMSFLTLGIFWVGQQTQVNYFERADRNLSWINLVFLSFVALMPFSTAFLAEFIEFRLALLVYWLNILLLGMALFWACTYAERKGQFKEDAPVGIAHSIRRRIWIAQGLYAVGAALCLISTAWSIGFIVLVQLNYAIAPRIKPLFKL